MKKVLNSSQAKEVLSGLHELVSNYHIPEKELPSLYHSLLQYTNFSKNKNKSYT
jgi:hypothetical protein